MLERRFLFFRTDEAIDWSFLPQGVEIHQDVQQYSTICKRLKIFGKHKNKDIYFRFDENNAKRSRLECLFWHILLYAGFGVLSSRLMSDVKEFNKNLVFEFSQLYMEILFGDGNGHGYRFSIRSISTFICMIGFIAFQLFLLCISIYYLVLHYSK